jgi:puromycin-sensitive aminopeptidase
MPGRAAILAGMPEGDVAPDPSSRHRLPYTVSPTRYEVHLAPDLAAETFSGRVVIHAEVHEPVDRIVLHALELDITAAAVRAGAPADAETATGADGLVPAVRAEPEHDDRIVLELPQKLPAGPVELELEFSGKLLEQLHGFYRSSYTDAEGTRRTIAVTQFETADARRAFPCFDEPDRKAVFSVSTDVPPGLAAFSNAPAVSEQPLPGGATRVQFADTIRMSTYLVALVIGPLVATAAREVDGVPVRVVHVPGREHLTGFALDAAEHALRYFVDWFGLPYPGAKLDLVAVPDFAFGAMENLGCVVFRETTLLVDRERASRLEFERVADVVAHEIAHMWFGDLVTMKWWNGIWLNEAFASLMEMLATDHFRPEWERWVSFGCERDSAMATDALESTRPVEYPVGSPDEANGMFDVLTYQKGSGVLRMLERYLGEDAFRAGIRKYLADHQLANTDTADLWDAIAAATSEPVRRIMDSWILQGGFPLVSVSRAGDRIRLGQEPFTYRRPTPAEVAPRRWATPVMLRPAPTRGQPPVPGDEGVRRVLLDDETTVEVGPGPVVVNAGGWGFYRVRYDAECLDGLVAVVDRLETLERYNLLSDTWAGVVAGEAELRQFLRLAEALALDPEPGVWRSVSGGLDFLDHVVEDSERAGLAAYVRALVAPAFESLGWERRAGEGERTATLRADLLRLLGTTGADDGVRIRCLELHDEMLAGRAQLDPDLAPAIVSVVARAGGRREYEAFLQRHHHPATPQEGVRYLQALAAFEDLDLAERTFTMAATEARSQDGPFVVYVLLANRIAGAATWARLAEHWDELHARFPANIFSRMLEAVRLLCRDGALVEQVRSFLAAHPVPSGQRTIDQAVERQQVNHELAVRLGPELGDELLAGVERLAGR